jgi:hypothetical protein
MTAKHSETKPPTQYHLFSGVKLVAIHESPITPIRDNGIATIYLSTNQSYQGTKRVSTETEQNQLTYNYCYRKWYGCLKNSVTEREAI